MRSARGNHASTTEIYQQPQPALTEVTNLQIQVMDTKDQLSLMSRPGQRDVLGH